MLRKLIVAAAMATTVGIGAPALAIAQPPTPGEIVHRVDRGVHHVVTDVDHHVVHHRYYRRHRIYTYRTTHYRVRALCNDGRFHIGRTGWGACAGHGGLR